jgi:CarboxypepD_reg-like domain
VVDRVTGLPLESVNVFLASTTRGTVTDAGGKFVLSDVPPGYFQLTASRVGYEPSVLRLEMAGADTIQRVIALLPHVVGGHEVEVLAASPEEWRKDAEQFREQFLGTDRFGRECVVLNPEVVGFRRDPETRAFLAASDSILRVRNNALGYMLFINLRSFRWDSAAGAVDYTIYVRFEQLQPRSPDDTLQWNQSRREAYHGSVHHFLRALVAGQLEREAFFVMDENGKSMGRNARKVAIPLAGGIVQLVADGVLRIDYAGETEAHRSYVRLAQALVHVGAGGSLLEQNDFMIDPRSWWAQHRVGRMLPMDYIPH